MADDNEKHVLFSLLQDENPYPDSSSNSSGSEIDPADLSAASDSENECMQSKSDEAVMNNSFGEAAMNESVNEALVATNDDNAQNTTDVGNRPVLGESLANQSGRDINRKRSRNKGTLGEENWKKRARKSKRNKGLEYISVTNKTVPAKLLNPKDCNCKLGCAREITPERQQEIHKNFYALGDWALQTTYFLGLIKVEIGKRHYVPGENSRRKWTRSYYLPKDSGEEIKVCKKLFQNTLQLSDCKLSYAIKTRKLVSPQADKRGKHIPHNATKPAAVEEFCNFINRFPKSTSHYSRKDNPNNLYFAQRLSVVKLFQLYCKDVPIDKQVKDQVFRKLLKKRFGNIKFHQPLSDTCKKCDAFEVKIKSTEDATELANMKKNKVLHLRKAEAARAALKSDAQKGKDYDLDTTVAAFDLQKILPTPVLYTGVCYYKRQLWTFNLGCHNLANNESFMYVWDEFKASRGPQEIGSAVLKFIQDNVTTSNLILYSDACGGQNRNFRLASLWNYTVKSEDYSLTRIDHKFLVPEHSHLPCDEDFGLIEKQKKFHPDVYIPDDWVTVIKAARKSSPFIVNVMDKHNILSTVNLEKCLTNRKVDSEKQKVEWLKMYWMLFKKTKPNIMQFKYTTNEDVPFSSVDFTKNARRGLPAPTYILTELYPDGKKIAEAKINDLLDLLDYVLPVHHVFYQELHGDARLAPNLIDDLDWQIEEEPSGD